MDASKIKKGLGRGLSSLIGDTKIEKNITKLLVSDLVKNKFQPRKNFSCGFRSSGKCNDWFGII